MKYFPEMTLKYFTVSLCFFGIILSVTFINPAFALKECDFPAIFNFGASSSDTGGFSAAFQPVSLPYGKTYFHSPTGRFSDGRLIIDFIAKSFNLPYLSAYLDSLGTIFKNGANFAAAGSTIRQPTSGGYRPFYLQVQYLQFLQFKSRSQIIRQRGGINAELMPEEIYFKDGLYTFDIGQNDLSVGFFSNMSIKEVNTSVPDIINKFTTTVKGIYDSGGRSFWIHNTGPIGCLPYVLTNFPLAQKDEAGCAKLYNEVAKYFNYCLKHALDKLRKDLPLAAITYVDIYAVKYSLFIEPHKYGFKFPLVTCCGYGGKYNYSIIAKCGGTIMVNGRQVFVGSCEHLSGRVIWDGIHYTEAANKFIFGQISTGAFSDPPVSLKKACHKNLG